MLALAPQDDLTAVLKTFSPDQLLTTRRAIDALLTPDALRQANQQLSPLLRLPRSILERIVDYAVSYDHAIEESSKAPGLLEACHGLRQAASRAYYSRNTFKRKRSFREEELERWAKVRVGENRRYLGRVRLGPPLHCNNEEAESEARKLETRCCLPIGSVWCLSEDDFENDWRWWVNSLGETDKFEEEDGDQASTQVAAHGHRSQACAKPAASWYCSSWALRQDTDYFSLHRGLPTPESRPGDYDTR
ncbi:hypothetical protein SMMN14_01888 [Sphaerulina musiva]